MQESGAKAGFQTEDVHKLFDLLEDLYQGKKLRRDDRTVALWRAVLRPWDYRTVRGAVIRRARENRFLPDPSEVAAYCPEDKRLDKGISGPGYRDARQATDDTDRLRRIVEQIRAENGNERRTVIITAELTFVECGDREGPFDEDRLRRKAQSLKARLGADDVVVLKMQEFGT